MFYQNRVVAQPELGYFVRQSNLNYFLNERRKRNIGKKNERRNIFGGKEMHVILVKWRANIQEH